MRLIVTLFFAATLTVILLGVVVLGGNTLLTGRPLPRTEEAKVIVQAPAAEASAAPAAPEGAAREAVSGDTPAAPDGATPAAPALAGATVPPNSGAPEAAAPVAPAGPAAFEKATYVADAAKGEKLIAKCKACHTFGKGEANRTGPNLFGVVGRNVASHDAFAYSDAMKGKAAELGNWSEDHLFAYLENPKAFIPGNKMAFAGLKDPAERLDLIAYLKTLK